MTTGLNIYPGHWGNYVGFAADPGPREKITHDNTANFTQVGYIPHFMELERDQTSED